MRYRIPTAPLLAGLALAGCRKKGDDQPTQPLPAADAKPAGDADLPKDGPGDPALTYATVHAAPAQYRGKRVTWAFAPLSADGKRMMCALDMRAAMGPDHAGIYVVEFATEREAGDAFNAAAFQAGSTITGTVAGPVDQFLVVRDGAGVAQKDIPKVTVPLLLHPAYKAGAGEPGKGKGLPEKPIDSGAGKKG